MQELVIAQKIPREVRPITNYVTTQLDDAIKKGLFLIGRQGGYIYQSQGGLTLDNIRFILYNDGNDEHNVSYGIYKQDSDIFNFYSHELWLYPWKTFPIFGGESFPAGPGIYGISNLPPLNSSDTISIESQLKEFITNYLRDNIDFSIFDTQGFEIDYDLNKINVSVIIGENDVIAFLEYPLGIKKTITNTITNVSYFYTNPQIRLKKVYNFVDGIISKDIVDILFNITNITNILSYIEGISIEKNEGVYCIDDCCDDLIIIRDNKSMLYAEPYTFQFARENRYPALHWIDTQSIMLSSCIHPVLTEENIKNQINPKADDPDEDEIIFTYYPELPYDISDDELHTMGYIYLTIYAEEKDNNNEYHRDWQKLKLFISCPTLP